MDFLKIFRKKSVVEIELVFFQGTCEEKLSERIKKICEALKDYELRIKAKQIN